MNHFCLDSSLPGPHSNMASSQVEISASSPFGCDHSQRDICRDGKDHAAFHKQLHTLVRDHLTNCIAISSDSGSQENSQINNIHHWVRTQEKTTLQTFTFNAGNAAASPTTSPIKSRFLEHWAAKQSQMVSSIAKSNQGSYLRETRTHANLNHSPTDPSTSNTDESLPRSGNASEIPNLGASSLVQIWENRLNGSNTATSNHSVANMNSKSASISELGHPDNAFSAEATGTSTDDDLALADMQCNSTPPNIPPSLSQDENSSVNLDGGEEERVRVADIIRRLTSVKQPQSPLSSWSDENYPLNDIASTDQAEHRFFSRVISSPRIRGRQAFTDLLMQMERDRHRELDVLVERRAVSKFSHRGRIQSSLRLRILQRGMEVARREQLLLRPTAAEQNRCQEDSTIHTRERFKRDHECGESSHSEHACGERVGNSILPDDRSTSSRPFNEHIEMINEQSPEAGNDSISTNVLQHRQREKVGQSSHLSWQHTSVETCNLDSADQADSVSSSVEDWGEISEEDNDGGSCQPDTSMNYDWFIDISRPRSYWEDRRKEWYHEVLCSSSDNEDIRRLLERKTVSNFLGSDFRERMDQLMVYRLERQTQHEDNLVEESHGRPQLILSSSERHPLPEERTEEEEEEDDDDDENEEEQQVVEEEENEGEEEEEERESLASGQYHEVSDYFDQSTSSLQLPSASLLRDWSFQDNEAGNDLDRALPLPSQSSYQEDSRQSSPSINNHHPSLEMEVISNLGRQMQQLYHEMAELRKSINSCMDMQLTLQQYMKHQDLNNSSGEKNKACQDVTRKRRCCICYEMQVDSLLYRCGHMCTCLKCAHELQWSSGKCPICRAPIVDVVRAFTDS